MNRRPIYQLSVLFALTLGCGTAADPVEPARRPIIGGADSTQGQFPTVVGLLLDAYTIDPKSPNPLMPGCVRATGACTGTLIREDVILTASHCVTNLLKELMDPSCQKDPEPPRYTFEVDLLGAARGMRVTATAKAVAHPMFAPSMCTEPPAVSQWNDVALVFLKHPIQGVPLQKLARPADAPALLREGSKVRIVGYGKSKVDDDKTAGVQRFGAATLVKVGDTELQAGQMAEQQACQGDSGGPVFANPDGAPDELVQIGVASRLRTLHCPSIWDLLSPPRCENGVFYTRVDAYYDWIQKTITEHPMPAAEDLRAPEPAPDLLGAAADLMGGDGMTPDGGGCRCDVSRGGHGTPAAAPLLLFGMLFGRLLRRRLRPAGRSD